MSSLFTFNEEALAVAVKNRSGRQLFLIHLKFYHSLKKSIYPKTVELLSILLFQQYRKNQFYLIF